ncbi:MAG: ATP-binding protein [Candidatus Acidulodesulfobacterium sp.]
MLCAGLFLKGIYDMHLPHKFVVSGSGSLELKEKIHESLAGRKQIFEVNPLSFKEFVNFKTNYKYADRLPDYFKIEREAAKRLLLDYLNYGGYPRIVTEETSAKKTGIINEIFQSYIEKDISYLLKVEKIDAFKNLIRILASQSGKLININELSAALGIAAPTIKNYIAYAEKTFILRLITPFYRNIRSEIIKSPAVYFNDLGLRNFSIGQFGNIGYFDSAGFIFQNFVFNVLYDKFLYGNSSVHFWRSKDGAEVDFVIDNGKEIIPIEVKSSELKKPVITRSVKSFIEKYSSKEAWIINLSLNFETVYKDTKIKFMPAFDLI